MHKTFLFTGLIALALIGCEQLEIETESGKHTFEMTRVHVGFSATDQCSTGTKSVVAVNVENFTEAYLFAFWATGADAGKPCIVNGSPVAIRTTSKSFDWELPLGEPIEIYAMVNAIEDVAREIDLWACGEAQFTRDDLLSFTYICGSASDLMDLYYRENNMPMTGVVSLTVSQAGQSLVIPVKRLFAKFDISLDVSAWAAEGWTVTAARVSGARSNTEVPYFYTGSGVGFKQTNPAKFASVDESTGNDLTELNFRDSEGKSHPVTYYFLENCQGVAESASKWNSVALELGNKVENCSLLRIYVKATKPGYGTRTFGYRIYLDSTSGSLMKSTFNIIRNTYKSIVLKLGAPQDGFQWTNTSPISVAPGGTVSIPFETSLGGDELVFTPATGGLTYVSSTFNEGVNTEQLTEYQNSGSAVFSVNDSAPDGTYTVRGGNSSGDISDETSVHVISPVTLTATVGASHYAFQRFSITLSSQSMAGWSDADKNRLETAFSNLTLRFGTEDTHLISTNPVYHTSVNGTNDVINKTFIVMSTRAFVEQFEAYNTAADVAYDTFSVTITRPNIKFIESHSSPYTDNAFIGFDSDSPVYDTPITGETIKGYFQLCNDAGTPLTILAADLALGSLQLTSLNGFRFSVSKAASPANTYVFDAYLASWDYIEEDGFRSNTDDTCCFETETYTPNLQLRSGSGVPVCSEPVHLQITNPFLEWFPGGDFTPHSYTLTVDGNSDYVMTDDFSGDWPYMSSCQPIVLSHGNVNTSKGGYSPYALVWESHSNEVESVRVADDLHNYGCIEIGNTITHAKTGDTFTMLWGKVDVIREFVIYAGYQYEQKNYLDSWNVNYNSGNLSRFIPYIYSPSISLAGPSLRDMVVTTATAAVGINAVNPSENFYRETVSAEHWWPHFTTGSTDHSHSTLWDCEMAEDNRACLLQNKVVVYASPKTVTSSGELSYYELQYAGPRVSSHLSWVLGHNGNHADFIYSFRSVAYWNEPAFEFSTASIGPSWQPSIKTFSGTGEKYLQLGDYTRVRFYWRMRKENLTRINSYDTRYSISQTQVFKTTYNNPADYSYYMYYFGNEMFKTSYSATAYYDPRRNIRDKMKLYTPGIPFYRLGSNTVHGAFGGSFSGSYQEENIVTSHIMGQAYGEADSFWLPGNLIQ